MSALEAALPRWARVLGRDVLDLVATLGAGVAIGAGATGFRTPFAPWSAEPGQTLPLLARLALLFLALCGSRRLSWLASIGIGALFVGGLAMRVVAIPAVLMTVGAIRVAPREGGRNAPTWIIPTAIAIAALVFVPLPTRTQRRPPEAPREQVDYWRGRKNLRRAHAAALAWAKIEAPPGTGYLELARIDVQLGRADRARKVLKKVIEGTDSEDTRAKAAQIEASLQDEPAR